MIFIIKSKKFGEGQVIVDDEVYPIVKQRKWHLVQKDKTKRYYAATNRLLSDKDKPKRIYLHSFVLGIYGDQEIDHINRNRLDNRKENLRFVTRKENGRNTTIPSNNKSGFKGVHYRADAKMFRVKIEVDGKQIYGGYFKYAINAAKKYNQLAVLYFGEFANLNKIPKNDKTPLEDNDVIRNYIGVEPYNKKFRVRMYVNRKRVDIGVFSNELEAAKAWNVAVLKYGKPERFLNKIP